MKHFSNITSLENLKEQFKTLAKANHPDKGGKTETMQEINNEYDILFPIWKSKSNVKTCETAQSTRNEFYTAWGWKGENYNVNLYTKDIAKIVREYCKEKYPTYKFSITAPDYNSLHIALLEAPQNVVNYENLDECDKNRYDKNDLRFDVNYYHISDDDRLTELCREILQDVFDFAQTYNFDDSDSMIDYFHTNFYNGMSIGKWDKPFKIVERTARIKAERPTKANDQPEQKSIPENLDIQIVDYSEKAFVVIGKTKTIKEQLAEIGGKYNSHLKCGAGWVFSKKAHKKAIEELFEKLNIKTEEQRTPETIELNRKLEIVKIDSDYKFQVSDTQTAHIHGYCFYIEGKGYLAFEKDNTPYNPVGGIDSLQSILHDGGFLTYEGMKFINPVHEIGVQRVNYYKHKLETAKH